MAPDSPVTGIAEIVLWTHDLEKSYAFYRDLFGLTMMEQRQDIPPRFLLVAQGTVGVPQMIVLVPHPDQGAAFPGEKPKRVLHHMAFSVAADEYEGLIRRCREAGLEVRDGIHPVLKDVRTFYVDDPDGNEVEVISPVQ
jgi:catechol 2,3-dioxygenase-like lactoylglutathione lyase family enzyme